MSDDGKNKIDAVINEVLESKRLKQGFGFLFKTSVGIVVFIIVILLVLVATGVAQ